MNHHVLLAIQAKLKLANCYYFSVAIDSRAKSLQKCGKSRETFKFWNGAISKYIQLIFYYVMEKLLIFNICKIWTGVMWSTLKISSGAQLGHDKRVIPAFDTVFFHSNSSRLWPKYLSDVPKDKIVLNSGPKISKRPLKRRYWWLKNKERKCHFRFVERGFLAAINCTVSAEGALVPVLLRITHWPRFTARPFSALLFIGHARATSFSSARTDSKTQQNIERMTFALTWCANIFVGCSVTPTFFRQITSFSDSFHHLKNKKKSVCGKF